VLSDNRVLDALIHVDPENDAVSHLPVDLPARERVITEVNAALAAGGMQAAAVNIHYLSTGLDVEVVLPAAPPRVSDRERGASTLSQIDLGELKRRLGARKLEVLQELEVLPARTGGAAADRAKAAESHGTV
jgi:hypothetical protein